MVSDVPTDSLGSRLLGGRPRSTAASCSQAVGSARAAPSADRARPHNRQHPPAAAPPHRRRSPAGHTRTRRRRAGPSSARPRRRPSFSVPVSSTGDRGAGSLARLGIPPRFRAWEMPAARPHPEARLIRFADVAHLEDELRSPARARGTPDRVSALRYRTSSLRARSESTPPTLRRSESRTASRKTHSGMPPASAPGPHTRRDAAERRTPAQDLLAERSRP